MRKVIVSNLMSLDGFMAGPEGEIDWFVVDKAGRCPGSDKIN